MALISKIESDVLEVLYGLEKKAKEIGSEELKHIQPIRVGWCTDFFEATRVIYFVLSTCNIAIEDERGNHKAEELRIFPNHPVDKSTDRYKLVPLSLFVKMLHQIKYFALDETMRTYFLNGTFVPHHIVIQLRAELEDGQHTSV